MSHNGVKTGVYVDALVSSTFRAFASQSTLDGGRGYVPVIGPLWRWLLGEVPVVDNLFIGREIPKMFIIKSLALTNSFITPTAMGVAILCPTDLPERSGECKGDDLDKVLAVR